MNEKFRSFLFDTFEFMGDETLKRCVYSESMTLEGKTDKHEHSIFGVYLNISAGKGTQAYEFFCC